MVLACRYIQHGRLFAILHFLYICSLRAFSFHCVVDQRATVVCEIYMAQTPELVLACECRPEMAMPGVSVA